MLQKFFFVGVGGSGGVTLRLLRSLLAARLREAGYSGGIPAAWQFAHIDVPVTQDTRPEELPLLPENNYAGLAVKDVKYRHLDETVSYHGEHAVRHAAAWRPDPAKVRVDPTVGAGKFRAVGRMILGAQMEPAYKLLSTALSAMQGQSANQEFSEVCLTLTGSGTFVDEPPQVVVVSSLAGGSGAGTVSDVCDLLLQLEPAAEDRLMAVLYTPEVFDELKTVDKDGLNPNALAALSELLNGYWIGQSPTEEEFAFVSSAGAFANRDVKRRGPRLMYMIGRSNGEVTFANQVEVYRTVAKAMTVLATNPSLQDRLRAQEIGNWSSRAVGKPDTSGLCTADDERPLSSFGFASVGIGMDRFARYAAERLARDAIDHLLGGHWSQQQRDIGVTEEEARQQRAADVFRGFLRGCGLEEDGPINNDIIDAIRGRTEPEARRGIGEDLQEPVLALVTQAWPANAGADLAGTRTVDRISERWLDYYSTYQQRYQANAAAWVDALQAKVTAEAARLVAVEGTPVARAVIDMCVEQLTTIVVPELQGQREVHHRLVGELRGRVRGSLVGIPGALRRDNPRIAQAVSVALDSFHAHTEELVEDLAVELIGDLAENLLRPLRRAIGEAGQRLEVQLRGTAVQPSKADRWPVDEATVPSHYVPPPNELVLVPVSSYPALFESQLTVQVGETVFRNALVKGRREIIEGLRDTVDGGQTVIAGRGRWQPRDKRLPQSSDAQPAEFVVHLDDEMLLDRSMRWIRRPDSTMGAYLGQTLTDYLGRLAPDPGTSAARGETFRRELAQAVVLSRPLVNIDPARLRAVHPGRAGSYREIVTRFPFEQAHPGRAAVEKVFGHYSEADLAGLFGGDDVERIDIFTFLEAPVQPMVMSSFVDPIRKQWDRDRHKDDAAGFWTWRRARSLPQFVPCVPEVRKAIVLGWFTARFLNQIRCVGKKFNAAPTEVWSPGGGWLKFPFPLVGLPRDGVKTDDWLPAVVESLCLTLINEPFDAYRRLVELGRSVGGTDTGDLQDWVTEGRLPAGAPAPAEAEAGLADGSAKQRAERLSARLDVFEQHYAEYELWPLKNRRTNGAWELREDVREALGDIRRAVGAAVDSSGDDTGIG